MALVFVDSFDHYTTAEMTGKWDTVRGAVIQNLVVRSGLQAVQTGQSTSFQKTLPAVTQYTTGFAFQKTKTPSAFQQILWFLDDGGVIQCRVYLNANDTISLVVGATVVATSTYQLPSAAWHYIEVQLLVNNTTGSFICKVDGVTVVTFTGNTFGSGNHQNISLINYSASISDSFLNLYWDDLYITDASNTSGVGNTGFLGDKRICCLFTRAAGSNAAWTPNPNVANFLNVQENLPGNDGDTSYNATLTVNAIDSFLFQAIPFSSGVIQGVQEVLCARIDDAGPHTIQGFCKSGAFANVVGPTFTVPANYGYTMHFVQENDPNTPGVFFTIPNFNLAEWGYKFLS